MRPVPPAIDTPRPGAHRGPSTDDPRAREGSGGGTVARGLWQVSGSRAAAQSVALRRLSCRSRSGLGGTGVGGGSGGRGEDPPRHSGARARSKSARSAVAQPMARFDEVLASEGDSYVMCDAAAFEQQLVAVVSVGLLRRSRVACREGRRNVGRAAEASRRARARLRRVAQLWQPKRNALFVGGASAGDASAGWRGAGVARRCGQVFVAPATDSEAAAWLLRRGAHR